jgi:hypothetical protein
LVNNGEAKPLTAYAGFGVVPVDKEVALVGPTVNGHNVLLVIGVTLINFKSGFLI